jgi:hypothetical protein
MEPKEPVDVWSDNSCPLPKVSLEKAAEYIRRQEQPDLYIQDADDNEFELLDTGVWNPV